MPLTEDQQTFKEIIEEVYLDGIDAIGEPRLEEENLVVDFQDGDKLLQATISDGKGVNEMDIAIKMLNPEVMEEKE